MSKHNNSRKLVAILTAILISRSWGLAPTPWAKTITRSGFGTKYEMTLEFYLHDTVSGKSPSAIRVAQAPSSSLSPTEFGSLLMADDPLTEGPDPKSKLVGRAQGMYGSASQLDEVALIVAMTYTFTDGKYKGSTLTILGHNPIMHPVREMPVLGGTGMFRNTRGYAVARSYSYNVKTRDAIVGYNVTLLSY